MYTKPYPTQHLKKGCPQGQSLAIFLCICLAGLLLAACGKPGNIASTLSPGTTFEISPLFREFHAALGGEGILGPAISQLFNFEEYQCQYTVNALMCQNPKLSGDNRFFLYPLGKSFNIPSNLSESTTDQNARVVKGIPIFDEFIPLYDQLSGERYAGIPITGVNINNAQQRIEQYFENVGFYRKFTDAPGSVRLLAYGAYACAGVCNYAPEIDAQLFNPAEAVIEQPFQSILKAKGLDKIVGTPLTHAYIAEDGKLEQVYTNAVLFSPPEKPKKVALRPISVLLGMPAEKPGPQRHKNDQTLVFYTVRDNLGFHVPARVDDFIKNHGGRTYSGNPISESAEIETGIYRQCFTNYCLLYQPSAEKSKQVKPVALGQQYIEQMNTSQNQGNQAAIFTTTVNIHLTEKYRILPKDEVQRIDIQLTNVADQSPIAGIASTLDILLPDGTHYTGEIRTTGEDGTASIEIPAMNSIPNGSLLTYEVCLKTDATSPVCANGSYLVWNTR